MNYVHLNGGWKGRTIDWNPTETIDDAARLGERRRTQAETEMEETMARLRAMILQRHEDSDFEIDLDSDSDDEAGARVFERPIIREAE